jgi:hypothetical protein
VSLRVRDIDVEVRQRRLRVRRPNALHDAKFRQIAECDRSGVERLGASSQAALLAAGGAVSAARARSGTTK